MSPSPPSPDSSIDQSAETLPVPSAEPVLSASESPAVLASRPPSFVKLAMRNMVRKRGTSLYHFALTTLGLLSVLVGLAYLTR